MSLSRNLHHQIAENIALRIIKGEFPPGSNLPFEEQLNAEYDVGRSAVREGLRILAAKGLIETRTRRGTSVRDRADWNTLDSDMLEWQRAALPLREFVRNLHEVRALIEPGVARVAALRATSSQIEAMRRAFEVMQSYATDMQAALAADQQFHTVLLSSTGNDLMTSLTAPITQALKVSIETSVRRTGAFADALPLHGEILDAIERRHPEDAMRHSQALVDMTALHLEEVSGRL
jgi:DNA-binding FadR family transcriptional regulator